MYGRDDDGKKLEMSTVSALGNIFSLALRSPRRE